MTNEMVEKARAAIFRAGVSMLTFSDADKLARAAITALTADAPKEVGEMVEALLDELTCRDDDAHYCPNCDNSLFDAKTKAADLLLLLSLRGAGSIHETLDRLAECRDWMERAADRVETANHQNNKSMASHLRRQADYNRELIQRLKAAK